MRHMNFKNNVKRAAGLGAFAAAALLASQAAMACQLTAWTTSNGAVLAGDPANTVDDPAEIPRYQGLCGLEASGAGFVQDDSPGGIDRIRARFYVLLDNSGTATIYRGADNADGTVFTVDADASGNISLIGGGATVGPVAGASGSW